MDWGTVLVSVLTGEWARAIGALILLDVVSGVAAAIAKREFEFQRMGEFLITKLLPFGLVLGSFASAAQLSPEQPWLGEATKIVYALVLVALAGSIANNLKQLGINIPIPGV